MVISLLLLQILLIFFNPTQAFVVLPSQRSMLSSSPVSVSNLNKAPPTEFQSSDDENDMDDENLLKETSKKELVELCDQFDLSTKGNKSDMLLRLREYATGQQEVEKKRLLQRRKNVEEGTGDERERFEIVDDAIDADDEEDEIFFYYESKVDDDDIEKKKKEKRPEITSETTSSSQGLTTAPPPPPVEPDENGERVVTVYSTMEQNDLTGVAAAQPGQAASFDPMTSSTSDPADAPWDTNNPRKADSSDVEIDAAKEAVTEVVQNLLSMTGLQGFSPDNDDEMPTLRRSQIEGPIGFVDFDPSIVPAELLGRASKSIRTGRGEVLREVLREFELRAIGDDGSAIDDVEKGGGHYRQVSKVRSFLEGFRRAEVRRLARETVTLLLDKLVSEGIEGLDVSLASMARSSDDTADEAGELNDSLLDYLDDAIRQQGKKVDQIVDSSKKIAEFERAVADEPEVDQIENLWKMDSEEGDRVEIFDPNDLQNKKALTAEFEKVADESSSSPQAIIPSSAQEKLLMLLKILRERIKIEATFSHDEKSRNLRILAYCLQLKTNKLREEMIMKEFGLTLDRLDSFAELVNSSIEYGESTSHQLQPSKYGSLNISLLKKILEITKETKKKQTWKASGTKGKLDT
jgi:hypothetical protein